MIIHILPRHGLFRGEYRVVNAVCEVLRDSWPLISEKYLQ